MQPLFPGFSKEGGKGRLVKEETCVTEFLRVESRTVAAGMIVILVTIVLTVSHGHWRFFRLNWSNPLQISSGDDRQATFEGQSSQPENSGDTLTQIRVEGPSGNYKVSDTHEQNQGVTGQGVRGSKSLESLVHDLSNSVDKIFQRLDTRIKGAGHHDYAIIGDHFGYDYFEIRSKFEKCDGSPSRAMLEAIAVRHPELTVEEFARVVEEKTPRKDVAHLLRAYDRVLPKESL
ncbi:uncharacterized protein LOC114963939 isoform X1 [Acropora millepora]|uniref:uncharacterized protein LOC114963939 isoform X1 n=1 Tax=Acropora millepora TaxID=45264 RepID=UPI001CF5857D|nr:uncharacterized protein LOC114963939 isoform X1 [Acropora millepora]